MSESTYEPADVDPIEGDYGVHDGGGEDFLDPFAEDFTEQVRSTMRESIASAIGAELEQLGLAGELEQPTGVDELSAEELQELQAEFAAAAQAEQQLAEARGIADAALEELTLQHGQLDQEKWWKAATELLPEMQEQYGDSRLAGLAALQAAAEKLAGPVFSPVDSPLTIAARWAEKVEFEKKLADEEPAERKPPAKILTPWEFSIKYGDHGEDPRPDEQTEVLPR